MEKRERRIIDGKFFSSETWRKLTSRLTLLCKRYNKSQHSEDVINDYACNLLEGKSHYQTLNHFFIDYSIKKGWYKKPDQNSRKCDLEKGLHLDEYSHLLDFEDVYNLPDDICKKSNLTATQQRVVQFTSDGYHQKQISEEIGVSESRVCQMMKEVRHKIEQRVEVDNFLNSINVNGEARKWANRVWKNKKIK